MRVVGIVAVSLLVFEGCAEGCKSHADCGEFGYCLHYNGLCAPVSRADAERGDIEVGLPDMTTDAMPDACSGDADCADAERPCDHEVDGSVGEPCPVGDEAACEEAGTYACGPAGDVICRPPPVTGVAEERCDGADDDCDGVADEGFALGEPCAVGRAPACEISGERVCAADGVTTGCRPSVPVGGDPEALCDGADDDCDGQVDEGLIDTLATEQRGVCQGSTLVCNDAGEEVEPGVDDIPHREAPETSCDGHDNDCDGVVDEPADLDLRPARLNAGVCAGLTLRCVGGEQVEPTHDEIADARPDYEPDNETKCDSLDNDCDGTIDEAGDLGPLARQAEGVRGEDAVMGLPAACADAVMVCAGEAGWVNPSRAELTAQAVMGGWEGWEATERTCDGVDNDCDGRADEELVAPRANKQDGQCSGQVQRCAQEDGWVEPDYTLVEGYEADEQSCDGLDNDCDDRVDEADHLAVPPPDELERLPGVCAEADPVCVGGGWQNPARDTVYGYSAADDTCDGADNNCDGFVDDGAIPRACGPDPAAGVVLMGADDDDVPDLENRATCQRGVQTCPMMEGQGWEDAACAGAVEPSEDEVCGDGLDNDCNGWTDDGCLGGPCAGDGDCPTVGGIATTCLADGLNGRCGFGPVQIDDEEVTGCGCAACQAVFLDGGVTVDDLECAPCRARSTACEGRGLCIAGPEQGAADTCLRTCAQESDCRPGWRCVAPRELPGWDVLTLSGGAVRRNAPMTAVCRPVEE